MIVSPRQFDCMKLLNAEPYLQAHSINTLTLASLMRRGLVKAHGRKKEKSISMTDLGRQVYDFNMHHKIQAWKQDLAFARAMKGID